MLLPYVVKLESSWDRVKIGFLGGKFFDGIFII